MQNDRSIGISDSIRHMFKWCFVYESDPKTQRFLVWWGPCDLTQTLCYSEQLDARSLHIQNTYGLFHPKRSVKRNQSPDLLFKLFRFLVGFVVTLLVSILRILLLFSLLPLLLWVFISVGARFSCNPTDLTIILHVLLKLTTYNQSLQHPTLIPGWCFCPARQSRHRLLLWLFFRYVLWTLGLARAGTHTWPWDALSYPIFWDIVFGYGKKGSHITTTL